MTEFGKILLFGTSFGFTFAHALAFIINKKWVPHYLMNVVSLSTVLLVFVESEIFAHESGLLAVVVMGMVLGNGKLKNLKELLYFKESLSVLLISVLFILLAANINMSELMLLYTWDALILFFLVVFVIRPIAVFLSTWGSNLKRNEKLFISWVGPRGIVAAGIASLFGSKLIKQGVEGAEYITPLVFMVVLGTVLLNATTARIFAKGVGVFLKNSDGILIVGASKASRLIASYLQKFGKRVVLIDANKTFVANALSMGLEAFEYNIYDDDLSDNIELNDIGYLIAMTGSDTVNEYALKNLSKEFGEHGAFRVATADEIKNKNFDNKAIFFSPKDDYINISEAVRNDPNINEIPIKSEEEFKSTLQKIHNQLASIPLFVITEDSNIYLLSELESKNFSLEKSKLVYLGNKI